MQPRRRALAGMKEKIYCIAGRLLLQPRRLQFEYRQPTAGRGLGVTQPASAGGSPRPYSPSPPPAGGLRRRGRIKGLTGATACSSAANAARSGWRSSSARAVGCMPRGPGISSGSAKISRSLGELNTYRGLRQIQPLRRPGNVVFAKQHIQGAQQIEIQTL